MYLTIRGMQLLFLSVLFALNYCSHGDLIADTCKKTEIPNLCISTLRSDPNSKSADVKGLVRIILKVALAKANITLSRVNDLLRKTKDRLLIQSLTICADMYGDALDEIPKAIQYVYANNKFEAKTNAEATLIDADTCEDSFTERLNSISPFTADNNTLKQLAAVALDIIDLLG